MTTSWSIPEANGGKNFHDFPAPIEVIKDEATLGRIAQQIKDWNERLASLEDYKGADTLQIVAGGHKVLQLSAKGSLGLW
jgi:hypothetical protein